MLTYTHQNCSINIPTDVGVKTGSYDIQITCSDGVVATVPMFCTSMITVQTLRRVLNEAVNGVIQLRKDNLNEKM